jgi:flagellar basal body-associated protein FliL
LTFITDSRVRPRGVGAINEGFMAEQLHGQESRQGKKGKPVLAVLLGSLALLAVAIVGLMSWQGSQSPPDYAAQTKAGAQNPSAAAQPNNGLKSDMPASTGSTVPANTQPSTNSAR